MEVTANQAIPYPGGNDTGNGALDLQLLAERVDALAGAQQTEFRRVNNKPCRVSTITTPGNITANQDNSIFIAPTWTVNYNSSGITPTGPFDQTGLGQTPGIYHFGVFLSTQPTGATDTGSIRRLTISATIPSDATQFPASTVTKTALSTNIESGGGGLIYISVEMEVYTPIPSVGVTSNLFAGTVFGATFFHGNISSPIQLFTGAAWIYRAADAG